MIDQQQPEPDPGRDPVNVALLRLLSSRLSAQYYAVGRVGEANRWANVLFACGPEQVTRTS